MTPILHPRGDDPRSFVLDDATSIDDLCQWLEAHGAKTVQPKAGSLFVKTWIVSTKGDPSLTRSSIILFGDKRISVLGPVVSYLAELVGSEVVL